MFLESLLTILLISRLVQLKEDSKINLKENKFTVPCGHGLVRLHFLKQNFSFFGPFLSTELLPNDEKVIIKTKFPKNASCSTLRSNGSSLLCWSPSHFKWIAKKIARGI
ncbi:uncharacterized protein LOC144638078 [Oculina patagonica]